MLTVDCGKLVLSHGNLLSIWPWLAIFQIIIIVWSKVVLGSVLCEIGPTEIWTLLYEIAYNIVSKDWKF